MSEQVYKVVEEADRILNLLRRNAKLVKDTVEILERVDLMLRTGEIDSRTHKSLVEDYEQELIRGLIELTRLRREAKNIRAKLRGLATKIRLGLERASEYHSAVSATIKFTTRDVMVSLEGELLRAINSRMQSLEDTINDINIESEVYALVRVLGKISINELGERVNEGLKEYLNDLSDKWALLKSEYMERISTLEEKISDVEMSLKENDVRFVIGEYDKITYEENRIKLERKLNSLRSEIEEIREKIDLIDARILKCFELLGGSS